MKSPTDVVSGFILLGLCGVGAYSVATLPDAGGMEHVGPGAFPAGILVLLTALSPVSYTHLDVYKRQEYG